MKRILVISCLFLALLAATLPPPALAQTKDGLTVALVWINDTLDPHMHFERVGILVNINMFDSLLHKNAKLEYEPCLATSWKALSDTHWEFKLRKGVKFHDGDASPPRTSSSPSSACSTRQERSRRSTATSGPSRK